jgi:hypothetical protein
MEKTRIGLRVDDGADEVLRGELADPRVFDLVEGDADPRVFFVAGVGERTVVVGDAAEIFDADVVDAAGEFAAGDGAAAEGLIE